MSEEETIFECMDCDQTINPEDSFSMDDDTLEHYNCPCCFKCERLLGVERYPVPGESGYGAWAPAFYCKQCFENLRFQPIDDLVPS